MIFYQESEREPGQFLGIAEALGLLFERLERCDDVEATDPRYVYLARKAGRGLTPHAFFQARKGVAGSLAAVDGLRRIAVAYERFAISRRASGEDLDACAMAEFTRIPSASPREELSKVLSMAGEGDVLALCTLRAFEVSNPKALAAGLALSREDLLAAAELAISANDPAVFREFLA